MAKRDCYEILGVPRDASVEQIKKSYRQLALKYHPDRNPGDKQAEENFKEAAEAYQVLSDSESRSKYDRFGWGAFGGGGGFEGFDFNVFADDFFGDIFSSFFGTSPFGRPSHARRAGRDLKYVLEVTLEEAASGAEKKIKINKPVPCPACNGTRCRGGAAPEVCKQCGGAGQIRVQQGFFAITRACPVCQGEGRMIVDPCPTCGGSGQGIKETELTVRIPAGIDHGQRLKLRNEGEAIRDGAAGDLYVEIKLKRHKLFKRSGSNLACEIPISYSQAVLGGEVAVPTLSGDFTLKIPPGTPSEKVFKLRGKGIVDMQTGRPGDLLARAFVYVPQPQSVSQRQRELLEELAQIEGKPTINEARTFFEKVKEFFD